jgi:acetyl esterase/lipase
MTNGVRSWQMSLLAATLRRTHKPRYATREAAMARLSEPKSPSAPPAAVARRFHVTHDVVDSFEVFTVHPREDGARGREPGTVVYLHGGAYVGEIQKQHWKLIEDLVTELDRPVVVPIYGLAPTHHVAEALGLMQSVLEAAAASGPTYLVGDSAGGGLALAATSAWCAAGLPPPRGLTLIAPWLDASLTNVGIDEIEAVDPWLTRAGLVVCAESWSGALDLADSRVSPLFGDLTDVPLIDLYVGSHDITVADCRLLRDRLPDDRIRYHEQPGAVHVYPLLPTPEGRAARRDLIAHIKGCLTCVQS